jgi:hypothetical protein
MMTVEDAYIAIHDRSHCHRRFVIALHDRLLTIPTTDVSATHLALPLRSSLTSMATIT